MEQKDDLLLIEHKTYHNKELPALLGMKKWEFYYEMKPIRNKLGKRMGYFWSIGQVEQILIFFGIPYQILKHSGNNTSG